MKNHLLSLVVLGLLCMSGPAGSVAFARAGTPASGAVSFNVLHSFGTAIDAGGYPLGSLILSGRTLYGTTLSGGAYNYGTIFEFNTKTGKYTVLYSFGTVTDDGEDPYGSLILSGRTLYGMTEAGGAYNYGTIFEFNTKTGKYTVLYSFGTVTDDGEHPYGSLIPSGENLYGMTESGGAYNYGTIFEFNTKTGKYMLLHSFGGGDGENPYGSLILSGKNLYGMTEGGGANGYGTIFEFNTKTGQLTVLYSFKGGTEDGAGPYGSLILSGKNLYGMNRDGGTNGYGTIFKFNTKTLQITLLHSFGTVTEDGEGPILGRLLLSGKNLYGMNRDGGTNGYGTIFGFNIKTGQYAVLHSFTDVTTDGAYPYGSLILSGENLYGMAEGGGAENDGVIFSFSLK
ncbi:MAG: choice-of-anchor tandem repeat GloVer-containing protein [Syntrophobacteraceae bacterium]